MVGSWFSHQAAHCSPGPLPHSPPLQVLKGGENLLDKVQALEEEAARGAEALAAQRAAQLAAEARIAQLEQAASAAEGRYSNAQVRRREWCAQHPHGHA